MRDMGTNGLAADMREGDMSTDWKYLLQNRKKIQTWKMVSSSQCGLILLSSMARRLCSLRNRVCSIANSWGRAAW